MLALVRYLERAKAEPLVGAELARWKTWVVTSATRAERTQLECILACVGMAVLQVLGRDGKRRRVYTLYVGGGGMLRKEGASASVEAAIQL